MTYTKLEEKLRALPEECLEEVSQYVEFVLFKYEKEKKNENACLRNCKYRCVAQFGRALRSGRRGRWFKSSRIDFLAGAPGDGFR